MAENSAQDKNLPATPRKLRKAREEGQVPQSRDLAHFAVIAVGMGLAAALAPRLLGRLREGLVAALHFDQHTLASAHTMGERLASSLAQMLWIVLPLGLILAAVAIAASVFASGRVWSTKAMAPKFSRLNPISGLPRIFSRQQLITAGKSCLLALVLLTVGGSYLRAHAPVFVGVLGQPLPDALATVGGQIMRALGLMVLALGVFAVVDVPLQRFLHKSRLKMSLQEVKDETKEIEGNQQTKSRARARMREMANQRMLSAVPEASVVVMNPTHYAVALQYEDGMRAPRVVAKGADLMAMRIRDAARGAKVPVLEAPPLARALYAHADVDREIPMALYSAVAQVLAYVYQLQAAVANRALRPGALPPLQVPPELDPHNKGR